jgi:HPr kinase/phosphorylase
VIGEGQKSSVSARSLLGPEFVPLALRIVTGKKGLFRPILSPRVQKPGIAFAGYWEYVKEGRLQILGASEVEFLRRLPPRVRVARIRKVCSLPVPAFVTTKGIPPPSEIITACRAAEIPLFRSPATSSEVIARLTTTLGEVLAPQAAVHGVLCDVAGVGVLLLGDSGIGKSECGLDLVTRGHRLVADDLVQIKRYADGSLIGRSSTLIQHHMELRGIGIINIQTMFGVAATRGACPIDLIVQLEKWDPAKPYDRIGLSEESHSILGAERPLIRMPVASGRNLSILVEIAVRNHLLKAQGFHAAREFAERIDLEIARGRRAEHRRSG